MLLNLFTSPPEIPETYATGLVSEGEVRVTSNASIYIDAGVHGNAGFDLGGTFYECTARDAAMAAEDLDVDDDWAAADRAKAGTTLSAPP